MITKTYIWLAFAAVMLLGVLGIVFVNWTSKRFNTEERKTDDQN